MNLYKEINQLPRMHQVALAAHILKQQRPSIGEIARTAGACDESVRGWLGVRNRKAQA